jgi:transposase
LAPANFQFALTRQDDWPSSPGLKSLGVFGQCLIKIVYLVTSEWTAPKRTINAYKKRWGIEKVFRTTKQHLGLRDCQARSASKQEAHIFAVFVTYAFLSIQKINHKTKNPEQILHKIRHRKSVKLHDQFETFCGIA